MTRVSEHKPNRPIWFDLATNDADGAREFYQRVLGWQYDISGPEFGHYAMAKRDGAVAAGIGPLQADDPSPPAWTVYFGVTSADATAAKIVAKGGRVMVEPMDVGSFGRMAICQDPTGAVFGLWQPMEHRGAEVLGEPGGMVWSEANTRDPKTAARFYCDVFGLKDDEMEMQGAAYHMLMTAEGPACGVLEMTAEWGDMPPHWMAYFAVEDADEAKAKVIAAGGTVPFGPFESPYGRIIVATDPQGAAISLIELSERPQP
jgi:uncharacterized protein